MALGGDQAACKPAGFVGRGTHRGTHRASASGPGATSAAMNPEAWIVLGVGICTVLAQLFAARRVASVAEKQVEVAERQVEVSRATGRCRTATSRGCTERARGFRATLHTELAAVLIVSAGGWSTDAGQLQVHNGGRHPAIDLVVDCLDGQGQPFASGRAPMVEAASYEEVVDSAWLGREAGSVRRAFRGTAALVRWARPKR